MNFKISKHTLGIAGTKSKKKPNTASNMYKLTNNILKCKTAYYYETIWKTKAYFMELNIKHALLAYFKGINIYQKFSFFMSWNLDKCLTT